MKTYLVYSFGSSITVKEMNNEQHAKNYLNKVFKYSKPTYTIITDTEENIQGKIAKAQQAIAYHNVWYPTHNNRYSRYNRYK